jgi:hypothetical protein
VKLYVGHRDVLAAGTGAVAVVAVNVGDKLEELVLLGALAGSWSWYTLTELMLQ